jgi:hypothetical protein
MNLKEYYQQVNEQDQEEDNIPQGSETSDEEMRKMMVRRSEFISELLYVPNKKRLIIRFSDGPIYRYENVDPMIGDWIMNGQHVGHKFNKHIRNNGRIKYERVY